MKKLTLEEFNKKLKLIHPNENLEAISYGGDRKETEVICLNCGTHYIKNGGNFLDKRKTSICKKCFPTHSNKLKENYIPPKGYVLKETYKGMHNKILVQHNCGFIWKITPNNLDMGKGCPKCNKLKSKGEQKIEKWLIDNNINYIFQYPMKLLGHNLIFDFYLPDFDLYIEYNGEQHYKPIKHFGGEKRFLKQVELDNIKINEIGEKLLIISYLDFQNIENILKSSTTIPNGSRE